MHAAMLLHVAHCSGIARISTQLACCAPTLRSHLWLCGQLGMAWPMRHGTCYGWHSRQAWN